MSGALSWQDALAELKAGNVRHYSVGHSHPRLSVARRYEIETKQNPSAVILGCSDSRVPPELIFDQGLGDLFVIRVAGHVLDDIVIASLEYAAAHLEVPLIVVLGHSRCGAVSAAVKAAAGKGAKEGHILSLLSAIETASAREAKDFDDQVERVTRTHIHHVAWSIRGCKPILAERVQAGTLEVVEAYYDIGSGSVEFIS